MSGLMLYILLPPHHEFPEAINPAVMITSTTTPLWWSLAKTWDHCVKQAYGCHSGWNQLPCITRPNGKPKRLGLGLPSKKGETPSWWLELQSLSLGQLSDAQVWEVAKKQALGLGFLQPGSPIWVSGTCHLAWVVLGVRTSYQNARSRVPGSSRRWGERRLWHWLRYCNTASSSLGILLV